MTLDNENLIVIESTNRKCLFGDAALSDHPRLNTGDIGEWTEGNNLVWKGREDDIAKVFGRYIYIRTHDKNYLTSF